MFQFKSLVLATTAAMSLSSHALTKQQALADFNQLNYRIESGYGPYEYKQKIGIDLKALKEKYARQIEQGDLTSSQLHYLLIKYVAEFRDGHFGARIPTPHVKSVPVVTELVDGKVLIDTIDRTKLSVSVFPFEKGDEVISVDGKPMADFLNEYMAYVSSGTKLSQMHTAAFLVFYRPGRMLPVPTAEKVKATIRRGTSQVLEDVELKWIEEKSGLDEFAMQPAQARSLLSATRNLNFDMISSREMLEDVMGKERLERSYQCSGATRITIPKDAVMLQKDPFVAYYHETPRGKVGYLRIPHYSWNKETDPAYNEKVMAQYEYAILELEKNTVGLVIDQDHNCGGSVSTVEQIVSYFTRTPVPRLQFELLGSKENYLRIQQWSSGFPENTLYSKYVAQVAELVKGAWLNNQFLTSKVAVTTGDPIYPNNIRYTKPVVILIDEMAGSGGDAFPSLMKGYGLATLVGKQTSGLGGHVTVEPALNYSSITIRMTKSLFYRPDGVPVENNGAIPDVEYSITRDDFLYGYKDYQKFYLQVLASKLDQVLTPH